MEWAKIKNDKVDGDKSLYICTLDCKVPATPCYVIHAVKVKDLLSCTCKVKLNHSAARFGSSTKVFKCESCSSKSNSQFIKLASMSGPDVPAFPGVGVSGSKILFAGGMVHGDDAPMCCLNGEHQFCKSVYEFETNDPEACIKPGTRFGVFQEEKPDPLVVEVDGALYALASRPQYEERLLSFEVFCPATQKWLTMPTLELPGDHPIPRNSLYSSLFSYAIVGTKILVASQASFPWEAPPYRPPLNFCFDVANPRKGWIRLAPKLPSLCGNALVVDLEENDNEKLMFTYEFVPEKQNSFVVVYSISSASSRSNPKHLCIMRPHLPPEFCSNQCRRFSFAHLGGQYICLAVSRFVEGETESNGKVQRDKMRILLSTFKFFYSTKRPVFPSRNFQARALGSHIFEYDWSEESDNPAVCASLLGCFVL